jgi:hypothetical protein
MKKISTILLLFCAIVIFASWQYRLFCLLLIVIINRKWLKEQAFMQRWKHSYKCLVIVLLALIYVTLPNYFQRGRTQLHYLDADGKRTNTPTLVYLANVIFPEKEVMNLCYKGVAILPTYRMGWKLMQDAHNDFWTGQAFAFYQPYNTLSLQGSNPGSFTIAQTYNTLIGTNHDAIYITRPKHYDSTKNYPVVFFCHGYLGSWELYQGILSRLENCIVVSVGTNKLDGLTYKISDIFKKYIPYVESLGYNIDMDQLHLIGLSNGGQASNLALKSFDKKFKTITFLSTPCYQIKHSSTKVLLIGGGKDGSAIGLPSVEKQLKAAGTATALYYDQNANHYIFAYQRKDIIEFLNKEMGLLK